MYLYSIHLLTERITAIYRNSSVWHISGHHYIFNNTIILPIVITIIIMLIMITTNNCSGNEIILSSVRRWSRLYVTIPTVDNTRITDMEIIIMCELKKRGRK